ncbi:bifunctional methyltransferase/pyrophosphohydrolase YabN [Salinithrix halophila]|uniref:Nucleoside triphosphate pyrophosphohydrolase n=1 Tax=Salinithrix halophila TaxID=1485204 RepID=A0ABV8JCR7_9BACL
MGKIMVVGLGSGDEESLSLGTFRRLKEAEHLWLRTGEHPVVPWLRGEGVRFTTFDPVYEKHPDFAGVYREITDTLLEEAGRGREVTYAVPGHPMVAETTVQLLLAEAGDHGIVLDIQGGGSFLDTAFARLAIDPNDGFLLLDGTVLDGDQLDPRCHLLISQVYDRMTASEVKLSLMEIYPDETLVTVATALGVAGEESITQVPLCELDREDRFTNLTSVYLPPVSSEAVLHRRLDTLTGIVARLRAPDGCPWDRQQTHESLRSYLLEEAYEFLEAVSQEDPDAMADELGDVLLQVLLHAQIGREEGSFDLGDVIQNLADKLIRRHPHVFGDAKLENATEVKQKWDEIKQWERSEEIGKAPSLLAGVPSEFPALLRAYKLQKKAAKAGFDWEDATGAKEKLLEEVEELFHAEEATQEAEMGDLLFSAVNLSRKFGVDPEQALLTSCRKFTRRFHHVEERARWFGKAVGEFPLDTLDSWWNEAKEKE